MISVHVRSLWPTWFNLTTGPRINSTHQDLEWKTISKPGTTPDCNGYSPGLFRVTRKVVEGHYGNLQKISTSRKTTGDRFLVSLHSGFGLSFGLYVRLSRLGVYVSRLHVFSPRLLCWEHSWDLSTKRKSVAVAVLRLYTESKYLLPFRVLQYVIVSRVSSQVWVQMDWDVRSSEGWCDVSDLFLDVYFLLDTSSDGSGTGISRRSTPTPLPPHSSLGVSCRYLRPTFLKGGTGTRGCLRVGWRVWPWRKDTWKRLPLGSSPETLKIPNKIIVWGVLMISLCVVTFCLFTWNILLFGGVGDPTDSIFSVYYRPNHSHPL